MHFSVTVTSPTSPPQPHAPSIATVLLPGIYLPVAIDNAELNLSLTSETQNRPMRRKFQRLLSPLPGRVALNDHPGLSLEF